MNSLEETVCTGYIYCNDHFTILLKEYLNGCFDPIDVPESCPTIGKKSENVQRVLCEAFESAVVKAQKQGIPEEEIFQFLEDVIDNRAADQALKEMERTGEKLIPWEKVKKEAGL